MTCHVAESLTCRGHYAAWEAECATVIERLQPDLLDSSSDIMVMVATKCAQIGLFTTLERGEVHHWRVGCTSRLAAENNGYDHDLMLDD